MSAKIIVLIHGLSENSFAWQEWKVYFENQGYTCYTPDYPYHTGAPEALRQNADKRLGKIRFTDVLSHYETFLDTLQNKQPILIGHSMGGLLVQKLIEKEKGVLGICITSAPPQGIITLKWSFIKANLQTINPFKGSTLFYGSKKWFHYSIANTLTREQSDASFEKVLVPESRNIPRSSTGKEAKIDFKKPHKPLLFISAEEDHITPLVLNRKNHKAYRDKNSICDFKAFAGKSHSICGADGWEVIAAFINEWIMKNYQ